MTQGEDQHEDAGTIAFRLRGQVDGCALVPWMARHAQKLGVRFDVTHQEQGLIQIEATGADEMTRAFALACSLGPRDVFVDRLEFL